MLKDKTKKIILILIIKLIYSYFIVLYTQHLDFYFKIILINSIKLFKSKSFFNQSCQ